MEQIKERKDKRTIVESAYLLKYAHRIYLLFLFSLFIFGFFACAFQKWNLGPDLRPLFHHETESHKLSLKIWNNEISSSQLCIKSESKKLSSKDQKIIVTIKNLQKRKAEEPFEIIAPSNQLNSGNFCYSLPLINGNDYWIHAKIPARKKGSVFAEGWGFINKSDIELRQNLHLISQKKQAPVYENFIHQNDLIEIFSGDFPIIYFSTKVWKKDSIIAKPPYFEGETQQDKIPLSEVMMDSLFHPFEIEGLHEIEYIHHRITHKARIPCFDKDYPRLKKAKLLIDPLRYICSKEEFEILKSNPAHKAVIDSFWLDKAGSFERAKVLIKNYYGRVQKANELYGFYKDGWLTDRGMIYIVYGPPDELYFVQNEEVWKYFYSEENLSFHFLTEEDGSKTLHRSIDYKDSWNRAVNYWRNGIVLKGARE